jgi:UTP--glucose-1-phosphate uridylyltransferase
MKRLAETQRFTGFRYRGRTYDTGTKAGFLIANVAYALGRPDIGPEFRNALTELLSDEGS